MLDKRRQFHSDDSSDEEETEESTAIPGQRAQFTVGLILDRLPCNILEMFSWQNWEQLSLHNFLLLCKKQKKLKVIDIGPMDQELLPVLNKNPDIFKNMLELLSIDMYPDTLDRLRSCQKILQDKPNIEYLNVCDSFIYGDDVPSDLHDSSTRPGLITRTLFSHMQPWNKCNPLKLKHLDLDTINLRVSQLCRF